MSDHQLAERDAVRTRPARTGAAAQARDAGQRRSAPADRSEDHLIRGYN